MEAPQKPKMFYGYVVVIACFIIMVVLWGTYYCFGIFFNSFVKEFGWNRASISGAYSIMGLMFGLSAIPIARLCSRYGPRKVIGACCAIMGVGCLLLSTIHSIWQLYLFNDILVAIGMGAYISLLPMVARWFSLRRSLMTGIVFAGMGLGTVIFPPFVNWLISTFQWRATYVILGIIVIVITLIASQFLKYDPRKIGLLPFGEEKGTIKNFKPAGLTFRQAIVTRQFWLISASYFTYLFCLVTVTVHIVIHAIGIGISPAVAAGIMSVFGVSLIVGMILVGIVADRYSNKLAFIITFALTAVAFIWLISTHGSVLTVYTFAVIMGFAGGGTQILFSPMLAEVFGLKSHGAILSTASFIASFGSALGAFSAGYIFDVNHSYTIAFIICAVLAALAVGYVSFLRPIVGKKAESHVSG